MSTAIAHRGLDDEGYVLISERGAGGHRAFAGASSPPAVRHAPGTIGGASPSDAHIGLGHRRFSIFDLSEAGHQPLFDSERSCCVFNGESYNSPELRSELESVGIQFGTRSDAEVLVESYKHWGTDCFQRFTGFWALALYDFARRRLILSRDRLGKKPLFWCRAGSTLCFASEINALLRLPAVRQRLCVNEVAASTWLCYGRKDLDGTTFFEGIHALPAASWAAVDERFPANSGRYWELTQHRLRASDVSAEEAADGLRNHSFESVRLRLRADVPVAVELSGGWDSSTLAALAAQGPPGEVKAYTVRFEGQWTEVHFASSVAARFGLDHQLLYIPVEDFWSQILPFTQLQEEPYHAPNLHTYQIVWAEMREQGTKVSLNGAAGDELFGGYSTHYRRAQVENAFSGRPGAYWRNARNHSETASALASWLTPGADLARTVVRHLGPPKLLARLRQPAYTRSLPPVKDPDDAGTLYRDMTNLRMPYWLTSGDRGYMGSPVEVRAPFLDQRLVEYSFNLPAEYLVGEGWHKWVLRKATEGLLPDAVVWRRQELGFPCPYETCYAKSAAIIDYLLKRASNPFVDTQHSALVRNDWQLLSFLLWYELFFNENEQRLLEIQEIASNGVSRRKYQPGYLRSRMTE
jgi:asparagine synthase (glutamine-hydrolysing)